ncbi:MAG: hypothetical protein HOE82_08660 [Gammaproteobacteria bacterium]|nr:hypothetical protein [Gammaproteobacteria bacterium]
MSPKDTKKLTAPSSLTAPYSPKNNDNPTDIAHKEEEPKIHKKGEIENNETNVISVLTNVKPMPPGMFTDTRETTDEDVPLGTISNVATMLRHYRITNRYNVTRKKLEIIIPGMSCLSDNADNKALAYLTSLAALNRVPRTDLPAYLLAIGDDNRYNPVAEWINSVPWDGEDRLSQLLDTIRQTPEFPKTLKETLLKRWLISAVAAIYEKVGYRARGVLTLQGEQSVGKTTCNFSKSPCIYDLMIQALPLITSGR